GPPPPKGGTTNLRIHDTSRLNAPQVRVLVDRNRGQLAVVSLENDRVRPHLVIDVAAVMQAMPAALRTNYGSHGRGRPDLRADLYLVIHLHAVARLKFGKQRPH